MRFNRDFWIGFVFGLLGALLAIYSFFRIYWIMEVGMKYLRWHAVLWLYMVVAILFFGVSYILYKRGHIVTEVRQKWYFRIAGVFAAWYIAESLLRLFGIGQVYSELREGVFVNPAERVERSWYLTRMPNVTDYLFSSEYSFPRTTNAEGLSDEEWEIRKDTNEIRIITLGDSFTEGDGAPQDSSYPVLMEKMLQERYPEVKVHVMNAARCGSDPYFEYKKLTDRLLKYSPDIVLYSNSNNDLFFDHLHYGGMERFLPDSTVKHNIPNPGWIRLYEISYVFRLVMKVVGYDETLYSRSYRNEHEARALADGKALSSLYSQTAVKNGFYCIQLIKPEKNEMAVGRYLFKLEDLTGNTSALPNYKNFDLLKYYSDSLKITPDETQKYFWVEDAHHNAKGYEIMAKGATAAIAPFMDKVIAAKRLQAQP